MKTSVFGIVNTYTQAEEVVSRLRAAFFTPDDISVLFSDPHSTRDFAMEKNTKAPEGAAIGGATGGVLGGVAGWLIGIGSLAIPGVGPFIAAGPIMAALGGAAIGAGVGGISGALIGLGMPELEAKRYEGKLKEGNALVSIHCDTDEQVKKAKDLLERSAAKDICTSSEAAVPSHR